MSQPGTERPEDYRKLIHNDRKKAELVSQVQMVAGCDAGHLEKFAAYSSVLSGKGSKVAAEKEKKYAGIGGTMKRRWETLV